MEVVGWEMDMVEVTKWEVTSIVECLSANALLQ